ncbi:MAG: Spo0E like sporulation regulatory protein [Candidatus Petromonas sp.]|jgi:vacuolar-type H+-ATPase subunit D/Vma8|nr:Spo0E like sporulation regulatory protein [Candidatus Petromonas sp.]
MLQLYEMKIQILRNKMHELIEQKKDLLSPEIINISQKLDKILNEYHKIANHDSLN